MSRAYRIKVRESLRRVLRASDRVSTQLELLALLPEDQMAEILAAELARRGFEQRNGQLVRRDQDVTITVDPNTATVTVTVQAEQKVELEGEREGRTYEEQGKAGQQKTKANLRAELRDQLEKQAQAREAVLQQELTDRLEKQLLDLRGELDQVVNRVTADALKQKAAQLGQIKEITEDAANGSMTIVLEV